MKYTVKEIDALREAVKDRLIHKLDKPYSEADIYIYAEESVRTYMILGLHAEDIIAEDKVSGIK